MTDPRDSLSRRERQILQVLFELGEGSVTDIRARLPDPPTATAVRTMLGILVERGHVRRRQQGRRKLYRSAVPAAKAGRSAFRRTLEMFFGGSLTDALAAHFAGSAELDDAEWERLAQLIQDARRRARR